MLALSPRMDGAWDPRLRLVFVALPLQQLSSAGLGYNNYLQQVWALFALLFAFGGLIREKNAGSVLFSLSLPVSRRRWLFSRLAMAFVESVALSLFAIVVVMVGSSVIQAYSLTQTLLHTAVMVGAGVFLIAFGNLAGTLSPGYMRTIVDTGMMLHPRKQRTL